MKCKWHWHNIYLLINFLTWLALFILFITTAVSEKEKQATIISGIALLVVLCITCLFIYLKIKGKLESRRFNIFSLTVSVIYTLFIISLFVPTEHEVLKDSVGTSEVLGIPERLNAEKQAGGETIKKLSKNFHSDSLTLTVYDICIGKYQHKINRDGPVNPNKANITNPEILTQKIKDDIKSCGADVVGITYLKPQYVFEKDIEGNPIILNHKFAIVIGKGIDYRLANPTAPLPFEEYYSSLPEEIAAELSELKFNKSRKVSKEELQEVEESLQFFSEGGSIAVQVAKYIRDTFGYEARAHFHRWGEVLAIPLAVESGLGECSKNSMVVNDIFGPRGSFAVITTDLPLIVDKPVDLGIVEFCKVCSKCADACPVKAIPTGDPAWINHVLKWRVDGEKCWNYIVNNPKCMACIGSCPFNKPDYLIHRIANFMVARKSIVTDRLLVWLDNVLGYGQKSFVPKDAG